MDKLIALWEGRVDAIDYQANEIVVQLVDVSNNDTAYTATISLDKIPPDERNLLRLGAVFHLIDRDVLEKPELLLAFRRQPTWRKEEIENIFIEADQMLSMIQGK